jgi:hypothetical protein
MSRKLQGYLVFVGGVVGVIGFFAPFLHLRHDDGVSAGSPSECEIVFVGLDDASPVLPLLVVAAYLPSLMLAVLGLVMTQRDRIHYPAIAIGLTSVAAWAVFLVGSGGAKLVDLALGGHALLLAGGCGVIGGVVSRLRARGGRAQPPMSKRPSTPVKP